jgi:hypothetical protein
MDTANLYIGTALVFTNATFQRAPGLGELVSYKYQWHKVTAVGHTWAENTSAPIINLSIEPLHPSVSEALAYAAGEGPTDAPA